MSNNGVVLPSLPDLLAQYDETCDRQERALASFIDEHGDVTDMWHYDEARIDFAFELEALLHQIVRVLRA